MARLSQEQAATIPALMERHGGNLHAVARELGCSHAAVSYRVHGRAARGSPPANPEIVAPVEAKAAEEEGDGKDERREARAVVVKALAKAIAEDTSEALLKVADRLIAISNAKANARKAAILYLDQRDQRTQISGPVTIEVKNTLLADWWERVVCAEVEDHALLARLRRRADAITV